MSDLLEKMLANFKANFPDQPLPPNLQAYVDSKSAPPTPEPHAPDLVPTPDPASSQNDEVDRYLAGIDIIEAYNRWANKGTVEASGKVEGIKVRCPNPVHVDNNPSAWINTDKQVWTCGTCGFDGGDIFDIGAFRFGFPRPGYKEPGVFPHLKKLMVEDFFGVVVGKDITGRTQVAEPVYVPDTDAEPEEPEQLATVTQLRPDLPSGMAEQNPLLFRINWQEIVAPDTFLYEWMKSVSVDDICEEFYFWEGLQAIGLALGRDVILDDNPTVKGNLFICLYGDTSVGKSRSTNVYSKLIREALPYDHHDKSSKGARMISLPGSPEALLDQFAKLDLDTNSGNPQLMPVPVRGLVTCDELALLVSRSNRMGSDFRPIFQQLYDSYDQIEFSHTSRSKGATYAERPFCSAITTTQTWSVKELMNRYDAVSGFMNRWVYVRGMPKEPLSRAPTANIDLSIEKLTAIFDWATPQTIEWTEDAVALWDTYYTQQIHPLKAAASDPLVGRIDLILKKLMLLFAANEHSTVVDVRHVQLAMKLVDYLTATYTFMSESLNQSEANRHREYITDRLRKWKEKYGDDAWCPQSKLFHRLSKDIDQFLLVKVLKNMVELGQVDASFVKSKNGKEASVYKLG